jgi:hypothetical protein
MLRRKYIRDIRIRLPSIRWFLSKSLFYLELCWYFDDTIQYTFVRISCKLQVRTLLRILSQERFELTKSHTTIEQ